MIECSLVSHPSPISGISSASLYGWQVSRTNSLSPGSNSNPLGFVIPLLSYPINIPATQPFDSISLRTVDFQVPTLVCNNNAQVNSQGGEENKTIPKAVAHRKEHRSCY